jgi:hypothetical protein
VQLIAEVGEVGVVLAMVAFIAAVLWLVHDHWRDKWLSREMDRHDQSLRLLGLVYCGRTGYGSEPSYFIWRSNGQRWVPRQPSQSSFSAKPITPDRQAAQNVSLSDVPPDRTLLQMPADQQDFARALVEAYAASTRELETLHGGRALLRWALAIVLPLVTYLMAQDPQYHTVIRLFGDALFGLMSLACIAALVWLIADERKARELRRRRKDRLERLRTLGLKPVTGNLVAGFGLEWIEGRKPATAHVSAVDLAPLPAAPLQSEGDNLPPSIWSQYGDPREYAERLRRAGVEQRQIEAHFAGRRSGPDLHRPQSTTRRPPR